MAAPLPPQHTLEFHGFLVSAGFSSDSAAWQAFSSASPASAGPLQNLLALVLAFPGSLLDLPSEPPGGSGSAEVRLSGPLSLPGVLGRRKCRFLASLILS